MKKPSAIMDALIDKIRQGDRRSLARAMSLVDRGTSGVQMLGASDTSRRAADFSPRGAAQAEACGSSDGVSPGAFKDHLRALTGQVPWWGITGPPGVGKSTLIDMLLGKLRQRGRRVGVIAVDPTSPLSNGALLGDRVRMMRHAVDREVFIRSLATRGREGGLSDAALHCARLLELASYDPVLIETVGVGQNEVDVASVADICVVMLGPGYGDDIQLIKAGLLEIADIVVVNKCDLPEANRLLAEVREELGQLSRAANVRGREGIHSPAGAANVRGREGIHGPAAAARGEVVGVAAQSGEGVDELLEKLLELDAVARGTVARQHHQHRRVLGEIKRSTMAACAQALESGLNAAGVQELVDKLQRGELSLDEVVSYQLSVISEEAAGERKLRTED